MPYTLLNAIKDEISFLDELVKVEKSQEHVFAAAFCSNQIRSLTRIVDRLEKGYDYEVGNDKKTGSPVISYKKTNRKSLQEEYPVLQKLAEQYELVEALVQSDTVVK